MTGLQQVQYNAAWQQVSGSLQQVRAMVAQIQTLMGQLEGVQTQIQNSITANDGLFSSADLTTLQSVTAPWSEALPAGTTFQGAVAAFLASNVGT